MKELGIYIHIPFCMHKCEYCDFVSFENKENSIEEYVESLNKEIIFNIKSIKEYIIKTIYIGGGTPSFINPIHIKNILNTIKEQLELSKDCEITIEVNPGTVIEEKLKVYSDIGISRLSIGMQAVDNNILKVLGRIHTYEEFLDTYNLAKKVGFTNINIDVMLGLPIQTIEDVEKTVNEVIKLKPKHISMYSLILEEGTKLEKRINSKEIFLPNEELERKMYWLAKKKLEGNGYIHYEISNFSKKGYESSHNLDCWNQKEYIGFGVAAHSYFNDKRYSNTNNLKTYIEKAKENIFESEIHEVQTKETKAKEFMLLALRKIEGVKISDFKNKFIDNPVYLYRNELYKLTEQGLITVEENNIRLTDKGLDLANQVWEEFV